MREFVAVVSIALATYIVVALFHTGYFKEKVNDSEVASNTAKVQQQPKSI